VSRVFDDHISWLCTLSGSRKPHCAWWRKPKTSRFRSNPGSVWECRLECRVGDLHFWMSNQKWHFSVVRPPNLMSHLESCRTSSAIKNALPFWDCSIEMTLSAYVMDSGSIFSQNAPKNDTVSYFGHQVRVAYLSDFSRVVSTEGFLILQYPYCLTLGIWVWVLFS